MGHVRDVNRLIHELSSLESSVKELSIKCPKIKENMRLIKNDFIFRSFPRLTKFNSDTEFIEKKQKIFIHQKELLQKKVPLRILKRRVMKREKTKVINRLNESIKCQKLHKTSIQEKQKIIFRDIFEYQPKVRQLNELRLNKSINIFKNRSFQRENIIKKEFGKVYSSDYMNTQLTKKKIINYLDLSISGMDTPERHHNCRSVIIHNDIYF